jgi:hypothetical protein
MAPLPIGSTTGECQPKHPQAEGGPPISLSKPLLFALVTPDREGGMIPLYTWWGGDGNNS